MNYSVTQFENPVPADQVRIFPEVWREHAWLKNIRSKYGKAMIGYPAKQIEWLSLGIHRIYSR